MTTKQTAGHDALGEFAPEFAHLNDDILFGEIWSREDKLSLKLRSIVTISALIGKGITDSSLAFHLASARKTGSRNKKWPRSLRISPFMLGGQMHGRHSIWQRMHTRKTSTTPW